jgi:hypothetical protein
MSDGNETNDQAPVTDATDETQQVHDGHEPHIEVLKGNPTEEELAALIAVLGSSSGGPAEPTRPERNMWGHPVDKLRYPVFSWQRVTLLERIHMKR